MPIRTALLVDDSPSARRIFQSLLEKMGLEVALAASGEEALGYLEALLPDVIFMDHLMRGMSGLETALEIARRPATAGIPVILLTSSLTPELAEQARRHGIWKALPKRANRAMIQAAIEALDREGVAERAGDSGERTPRPLVPADYVLEEGEAERLATELGGVIEAACAPVVDRVLAELHEEVTRRSLEALAALRPRIVETAREMVREIVLEALAAQPAPPVSRLRRITPAGADAEARAAPRKATG